LYIITIIVIYYILKLLNIHYTNIEVIVTTVIIINDTITIILIIVVGSHCSL